MAAIDGGLLSTGNAGCCVESWVVARNHRGRGPEGSFGRRWARIRGGACLRTGGGGLRFRLSNFAKNIAWFEDERAVRIDRF